MRLKLLFELYGDCFNCVISYRFHVFRSWGRIGTVIGGHLLDEDLSLNEALDIFNKHYQEKTGGNVFGKKFVMKPGHYMLLDISYDAPVKNFSTLRFDSQ